MSVFEEVFTLSNGVNIPRLALGTWFISDDIVADAVVNAIKIGYRHVDTAQRYGNERGVGEGIRACGIPREQIFVTSKVAAEHKDYASAAKSIDETLEKMQLDYIDMMIIHSPQPWDKVNQCEDRYVDGNRQAWRAMEDAMKCGKVRAIGVSNFLEGDLKSLMEVCEVKPMVDQILCHISKTPKALIDFCHDQGMVVEAYSPVGHGIALRNKKIGEMAAKYKVTIPQLCVRYDWQLGTIVLPKTANPDHMKNNADIDFEISEEDMQTLLHMEETTDYEEFSGFPVYGGRY